MSQQVRRHKSAVAVTANSYAIRIGHTHLCGFVDRGFRTHDDLFDIGIVNGLRIANDWHGDVVEHRITFEQKEEMRWAKNLSEALCRSCHLSGCIGVIEFQRISPYYGRQSCSLFIVWWQVKRKRALHSVRTFVGHELFLDSF